MAPQFELSYMQLVPCVTRVGQGCVLTRFDALCAHFAWLQISYASSVSLEVSRDGLPFYYQLLPTEDNYIPAVASIISYYGWMQFTIISEDEHVFLDVRDGMIVLCLFLQLLLLQRISCFMFHFMRCCWFVVHVNDLGLVDQQ